MFRLTHLHYEGARHAKQASCVAFVYGPKSSNTTFTESTARRSRKPTQLQRLKPTQRNFASARRKPGPPSRPENSVRGAMKLRIPSTEDAERDADRANHLGYCRHAPQPGLPPGCDWASLAVDLILTGIHCRNMVLRKAFETGHPGAFWRNRSGQEEDYRGFYFAG